MKRFHERTRPLRAALTCAVALTVFAPAAPHALGIQSTCTETVSMGAPSCSLVLAGPVLTVTMKLQVQSALAQFHFSGAIFPGIDGAVAPIAMPRCSGTGKGSWTQTLSCSASYTVTSLGPGGNEPHLPYGIPLRCMGSFSSPTGHARPTITCTSRTA